MGCQTKTGVAILELTSEYGYFVMVLFVNFSNCQYCFNIVLLGTISRCAIISPPFHHFTRIPPFTSVTNAGIIYTVKETLERHHMKKLTTFLLLPALLLALASCSGVEAQKETPTTDKEENQMDGTLKMKISDLDVSVEWEGNESVAALRNLAQDGPLTVQMSMYGGFEQVGYLGADLPRNDAQTVTKSGDIVLYSGDQIVVFYGSNSWAYTRLGHIIDKTDEEMARLLSNGDVVITLSLEE